MNFKWYQNAIIYQIYPRSFADSNGDGVGDLAGITSKLDYLSTLGVDAIWLSPIYQSPMADFGYDVSDHCAIDPAFGSLDDFDNLVRQAHQRDIKVMLDLVPNHTSSQHPWFNDSQSSKSNPKRDWYIWNDPQPDGSPPDARQSVFGGPAWTLYPETQQYYLHSFLSQQPDLNWANIEVQVAVQNIIRFWYDRGVDGFRVDAILFLAKKDANSSEARDKETDGEGQMVFSHEVADCLPAYLKVLTDASNEYPDRLLVFEAYTDENTAQSYAEMYSNFDNQAAATFNFGLLTAEEAWIADKFWKAPRLKAYLDTFQKHLPAAAIPAYVLGNHDSHRIASRIGGLAARSAAMMLLTLPGTKFVYYGEELGMTNVNIPKKQRLDPSPESRDPERTPMQWNSEVSAGFTTGTPWLPLSPDSARVNAATLADDQQSILSLYKHLIALAHQEPALVQGQYQPLDLENPKILGFQRIHGHDRITTIINFSDQPVELNAATAGATIVLSSYLDSPQTVNDGQLSLRPYEGVILRP